MDEEWGALATGFACAGGGGGEDYECELFQWLRKKYGRANGVGDVGFLWVL